ncbi:DUF1800 domain-containing protein [Ramlibacter sp.]|uniref:DUF1800 domain-containing protein n=1 Tax=Ramlibacter sp. TaxID=1917967 RepID=UPI001837EFC0|nr:DUF1800 domain-containing protein [Ramlibacter sp.]MBA2673655.1 DUF1800 domain-containing protein [Ramlibacter sp.]
MKRRAIFILAAALCAVFALPAQAAPAQLDQAQARHLLLRTGFAPTEHQVRQLQGQGAAQAVDALIAQARAARPLHLPPQFAPVDALPASAEERMAYRQQQLRESQEIKGWWMREMAETPAPLAERMVLFWHGHFATSQRKVVRAQAMWNQQQVLRQYALGNFRGLLHAAAKDPAMLAYLDGANSRKQAPNENFAREVMELFTLGEASRASEGLGGYSEQDIREAARAFTGWSIERQDFAYRFRPAFHDTGVKTVFGRSGNYDGDAVLDLLLEQPAAARFLTAKLWKEFVSPTPDAREVERIAAAWRAGGWDIGAVLRELLLSDAFWAPDAPGTLVKSPVELVVGAVRQFGVPVADPLPLVAKSAQLGQNLLVPPNVKGWPGYTDWIDAARLLERKRFAQQLLRYPGFDDTAFLASVGAHADREPDAAAQARLTHALLPLPPVQTVAAGTVGSSWVRALLQDAAYQLK